jgi:hypothetical protein
MSVHRTVSGLCTDHFNYYSLHLSTFSPLIIQVRQKNCEICGGSGLVMKNDYYVRCQGCGTHCFRHTLALCITPLACIICDQGSLPYFFRRWLPSMAILEKVLQRLNAVVYSSPPDSLNLQVITSFLSAVAKYR